ncbi:MAG: DNA-protecting protein DprA [Gammaproteobacteria bacterium]|nr:DNA-protecting protein DprA [Gammaproteobacteria bacterium]
MLWCQGNLDLLEKPCIAIIGSRQVTDRALEKAYELGYELGKMGYSVVSGLARGVDTEAHKGSLETGTVAVVASGFDYTYPKENTELFESIIQKGLAISEQPIDTQPQARHFPQRNRIVAGISIATVCVEAGNRSGSGITLTCARDIGRKTMAITPLEDLPSTAGYKFFLEKGATPVVSAQDIHNALQEDAK